MNNLTIRLKLILSIGMLAFGYLLFLGLIQWTGTSVQHHLRTASDSLFPAALAGQAAESGFQKLTKDYKDAVVLQDVKALTLAEQDARNVAAQLELFRQKTTDNAALQKQVIAIQGELDSFSSLSKATYTRLVTAPDSADAGTMAAMKTLSGQGAALVEALHNLNEEVSQKYFRGELATVAGIMNQQRLLTLILFLVALAFATFTTLLLQKQISVPLRQAVEALRQVADGNLTVTLAVNSGDEVGQMSAALNDALAKLRSTLHHVAANAVEASVSSRELAAAATAIASGAQRQAASLEQITATVRQSADNARQATQVASGSTDSAERGQEVVAAAVTAMGEINTASARISDIISTIDEIAFQTNLLAVNAAVEAARAGEEGRGFAVVATEVRTLALRSAGAAKEIKSLIEDSLRKVERGTELVNRSGQTLHSIVGSVKAVTNIVGQIAAAAAEQSLGVDQVNTAMTQMDQVTQSNAAETEQLSSTAKGMSEQSLRLSELVGTFVLDDEGRHTRAVRTPAVSHANRNAKAPTPRAVRTLVAPGSNASAARNQGSTSTGTASAVAMENHADQSFEEF